MKEISDELVVEQFLAGHDEHFRSLVERFEAKVFNTALYLTESSEDAEEVLQEVFAELYTKLLNDFGKTPLFDWLISYTLDLSVQKLIEKKQESVQLPNHTRAGKTPTEQHIKDFQINHQSLHSAIRESILAMPYELKCVFLLRDIQGMSLSKTASFLEINVFEARARLHEARMQMRQELKNILPHLEEASSAA